MGESYLAKIGSCRKITVAKYFNMYDKACAPQQINSFCLMT